MDIKVSLINGGTYLWNIHAKTFNFVVKYNLAQEYYNTEGFHLSRSTFVMRGANMIDASVYSLSSTFIFIEDKTPINLQYMRKRAMHE